MLFRLLKKTLIQPWLKISLLVVLFSGFFLGLNQSFRIKKIIVEQEAPYLIKGLKQYQNQISLLINKDKLYSNLTKNNPDLEIKNIKIDFPSTLIIKSHKKPAIAALKNNQGYFLLDKQGILLKKTKEKIITLPLIHYYQNLDYSSYNQGEKIDFHDLIFCLNLLNLIKNLGLDINSIDINSPTMIVLTLDQQKKITISEEKSISQLEEELKFIIKQLKIRGNDFSQLDLRFNKPIIIF
jgi:cell division septal protein FtsQ